VYVANIGDEDIYFKPRTKLGTVNTCEDRNSNSSISFNRIGSVEEIFIKTKSDVCEQSCLNPEFRSKKDIYHPDCSDEEKSLITSLFQKHSDVFDSDD
jgi:hypothetical protein